MSGGGIAVGGGLGTIALVVLALLFGVDPRALLEQAPSQSGPATQTGRPINPQEEELKQLSVNVMNSTEDVWNEHFRAMGRSTGAEAGALHATGWSPRADAPTSAVGPFYCPGDQKVYLDLAFFERAASSSRRAGRFRPGLRDRARGGPPRAEPARHPRQVERDARDARAGEHNQLSVRARAAGRLLRRRLGAPRQRMPQHRSSPATSRKRWARRSADRRRPAAEQARGYVVPDSFTHGSSEQRVCAGSGAATRRATAGRHLQRARPCQRRPEEVAVVPGRPAGTTSRGSSVRSTTIRSCRDRYRSDRLRRDIRRRPDT